MKIPPILPNDQIVKLIEKYQTDNDIEARNRVVMNNIRFVYSIAQKYRTNKYKTHQSNGYTIEDFMSEGVLGLIDAIDRFDLAKKCNFSTYAYWRVLKRINDTITIGTLNAPQHRVSVFQRYEKLKHKYRSEGKRVDLAAIAAELHVSEKILTDTIRKKDDLFLYDDNGSDSKMTGYINQVMAQDNPEEEVLRKIEIERMNEVIYTQLTDDEFTVIKKRFGLENTEPETLHRVSRDMGISREYVRVIQNKTLNKIKKKINKKKR